jgi:hypothetical protein
MVQTDADMSFSNNPWVSASTKHVLYPEAESLKKKFKQKLDQVKQNYCRLSQKYLQRQEDVATILNSHKVSPLRNKSRPTSNRS